MQSKMYMHTLNAYEHMVVVSILGLLVNHMQNIVLFPFNINFDSCNIKVAILQYNYNVFIIHNLTNNIHLDYLTI